MKEPRKSKAKALNLGKMTCAELVTWLENVDPEVQQPLKNQRLIQRYSGARNMRLLKLCGPLSAQHHFSHCLTARHLESVPTIEMRVAGGQPDKEKMPKFTASLKRIGAINGITIHRWEEGAFILKHPLKEQQ